MGKTTVLFVCVHNSARSQIAEALRKKQGGKEFQLESAGFEPGETILDSSGIDELTPF